jgi:uncharacterized membrane protein
MERGPLEVLVIGFPQDHLPEGVEVALDALRQVGDLRLISALMVTRPEDGPPEVTQVAAFDDVGDVVADILAHAAVGLIDADAVDQVVTMVEPGSTAFLALVEHVWAVGIAAEIREARGVLLDAVRLPADALAAAEEALGGSRERREG